MNNATMFYVRQKMANCASSARSAMNRVRQARTLREVRDFGNVHVDAIIRSLEHQIPELRQLERAKSDRAEQLVAEHLKELRATLAEKGLEAFKAQVGQRHQLDWIFLRGEHAGLFRRLDRDLATIEYQWRQAQPKASEPSAAPAAT